jgi:DNA-binding NarL/FixJ family response regulator
MKGEIPPKPRKMALERFKLIDFGACDDAWQSVQDSDSIRISMKRITVLLADDHTIVREAFRKVLEFEDDLEVVGEAQDGRQAVALAKKLHPDVILMDIGMPYLNGLEATRQIFKAAPATKVIMLTAYNDDEYVTNAMESGAMGFLLKQTSAHEVHRGIRAVYQGKTFFSASISTRLDHLNLQPSSCTGMINKKGGELTSREMEVLQLVAEGNANKQTASELKIATKTVEKHREHIMAKLEIHNTADFTRYAISAGMIESSVQFAI